MPGKTTDGAAGGICRRCKENVSVLVVRLEPLCQECFARYVHTKAIKRLETFRVDFHTNEERKVLLPLSFGVSSTTLLHILDLHLKTQMSKTGRTGFALSMVAIRNAEQSPHTEDLLEEVRNQYPGHEYASLPLHDVFRVIPDDAALRDLIPEYTKGEPPKDQEQLARLINSLTSATARADVLSTLRARLIVEHAKSTGCQSILWGDSTTTLAEKTLAETCKGRGFSLPWQVADGKSPFGVYFHYPLRDVLKKELVSYIGFAESGLSSLVHEPFSGATQASTSSKNTTIDDLMKQYFESVEENFPSIVSNVVRTSSKLEVPAGAESDPRCGLCDMPVPGGRFGIHGWGGYQQDGIETAAVVGKNVCYGCTRSLPPSATTTTRI
ncbi:cytoplasmic tRNA 2-thiolation protein 2 [Macroventuria anomochaeta]|uniref:Cytoplasmic tRNA 2-thiolation protein 2 n=1 Tax=Macroventuria anomochaeta TaxID=301207 RepID=A0ACB6S2Q0_9PLEO|nr:cytoplasmic tRNA 2-thiolation protein 2 [Macroventuria anomochaeta]KAF2627474.1 cytoplasmic tRNA 2-thiolation protein 2 [Macroventuria anomochaeta]